MLRGEDTKLVRPYLIAHERWEEAQQRRALRLVGHGHYIDPSFTHGVEVRV